MSTSTTIEISDTEFEALIENAKKTITESGQSYDETELRQIIGDALGRARAQAAEAEPTSKVDVNAGGALRVNHKPKGAKKIEPIWYESEEDKQMLEWFIEGRGTGIVDGALLIMGPSGSGKTEGVLHAGERLNKPVHVIHCASITSIEKWVGQRDVDKDGTRFTLSDVMEVLRGTDPRFPPGVALFDEVTRLHPTFWNILFPVFDGQRRIWIPEMHDYIEVHPQLVPIGTANIGGRFTGTYNMDHALRERFPYTIERDFPPEEAEVSVLTSAVNIKDDVASLMVNIANKTRVRWRNGDLSLPISTRSLKHAAAIVRDGGSVARAFEVTVLPMYPSDGGATSERNFVRGVITGKGGDA